MRKPKSSGFLTPIFTSDAPDKDYGFIVVSSRDQRIGQIGGSL